jgi:hypothetical protein
LTSLSSFLLIGYWSGRADARQGARMALTITGGGGLCLLAGALLIGHIVGSTKLDVVLAAGELIRAHPMYETALVLVLGTLLGTAAQCVLAGRALRGAGAGAGAWPAALLPRSAWSIDATTDVRLPPSGTFKRDVERDLDDPAVGVVLGVSALSDLADQDDGPLEDGLPEAPTPVQRWSLALRGPLERPFALATEEVVP